MNEQHIINQLAATTELSPETIEAAIEEVKKAYGESEVLEGLESLSERLIPTGEGLTRKEARKALVAEMNALTVAGNQARLRSYKKQLDLYWQTMELRYKAKQLEVEYTGPKLKHPNEPKFIKGYSLRRIDQAVNKARHIGKYKKLLERAGY